MSGSGNNKIANVLGASSVTGATTAALAGTGSSKRWIILTLSLTLSLALLAIILKIVSKRAR